MNANPQFDDDEITITAEKQNASAQFAPNHQAQSEHQSLKKVVDFIMVILHALLIFDVTIFALAFAIYLTLGMVGFLEQITRGHDPAPQVIVTPQSTPEPTGTPDTPDDKPGHLVKFEQNQGRRESRPKSDRQKFPTSQAESRSHYQPFANHIFSWWRPGDCAGQLLPRIDRMAPVEFRCVDGRWQKREL